MRRMEMSQSFNPFPSSQPGSPAQTYEAAIYTHPSDVTSDPKLTTAEKRAVLASWISDARAIEDAPALRRLDSGAVVDVDDIVQALVLLDEPAHSKRLPPSDRRRSVISKWLKQVGPRRAPTTMMTTRRRPRQVSGFRFGPPLSRPMGARPEREIELDSIYSAIGPISAEGRRNYAEVLQAGMEPISQSLGRT